MFTEQGRNNSSVGCKFFRFKRRRQRKEGEEEKNEALETSSRRERKRGRKQGKKKRLLLLLSFFSPSPLNFRSRLDLVKLGQPLQDNPLARLRHLPAGDELVQDQIDAVEVED